MFSPLFAGWLLASAGALGCSGNTKTDPPAQGSGGANSGGRNGTGGDITHKGGESTSAGASGGGGASTGGAAGTAGSTNGGGNTNGGASASSGAGGTSSGGGSGTAGTAGASTAGAAPIGEAAAAYCSSARTCCPKDSPLSDCETKAAMHYPTASIQSGAVRVDASALAACVAAYQKAAKDCQEIPVVAACRAVFVGTRKPGESCTDTGYDCSNEQGASTCLITTQGGHTGVCKSNPRGKAGDACLYSCRDGDTCGGSTYGAADSVLTICFESDGLYCDYGDSGATCQPIKKVGSACSLTDECGTKAYCETTCQRVSMEGESCGTCRHDLTCTNGTCQSPTFGQANACDGYSLGP